MALLSGPIVHHPTVFDVGPLPITGFGIAVALGFVIGHLIAYRELARRGHDPEPMSDVLVGAVLGFVIGAKLYFLALSGWDWSTLLSRSGMVFWGGLLGGIAASWLVLRLKRLPFLRIADVAGPAIAAGYAVGRTGCWAVGDDYGRPWSGPLAVQFPQGIPPSTAGTLARDFGASIPPGLPPDTVLAVHPTQLYETVLGFVMFAILWRLRDHKHAEGWLFGVYCVLAGVERFVVEFYRAKDDRFFGPFTSAQAIAFGFVVVGTLLMARRNAVGPGRSGIRPAGALPGAPRAT
jgi:phosphatidylglycerol:prolipoprotein diacylglycerol transferase